MGGITKSLWELISGAVHNASPLSTARVPIASQPGTPFVTQIQYSTIAELIASGISGNLGLFKSPVVQLNNADIIALPTTSKVIVPGVANKCIIPDFALIQWDFSGAAYTGMDATYCDFGFTYTADVGNDIGSIGVRNASAFGQTDIDDMFGNTTTGLMKMLSPAIDIGGVASLINGHLVGSTSMDVFTTFDPVAIKGSDWLLFFDNNGAGNLGGGNVANRMAVQLFYWLVDPLF